MSDAAEVLSREEIYSGRVVHLEVEEVRLPGGARTRLELVRHGGAAAIVPLTAEGEVVLVRQYRHATGGWLLEIPAGVLEPGEAPDACARREVEEETGLRAGRLDALGWIWSTPGFADERIWLFLARDLVAGRQALDADEEISLVRLPLAEAVAMAAGEAIVDAKSVCGILRAARLLGNVA